MADRDPSPGETMQRAGLAAGLAVGMGVGVAMGTVFESMGLGIAFGVAIGGGLMAAFTAAGAKLRRTDQDDRPEGAETGAIDEQDAGTPAHDGDDDADGEDPPAT